MQVIFAFLSVSQKILQNNDLKLNKTKYKGGQTKVKIKFYYSVNILDKRSDPSFKPI